MGRIFLSESQFRDFRKVTVLILGLVLISALVPLLSVYAATVVFSPPTSPADGNLTNTATGAALFPQIVADGTNVYTVWHHSIPFVNGNINFSRSVDSGDSFSTPLTIGSTIAFSGVDKGEAQIATSGTGVIVVWDDGDNLKFSASSDSGASFSLGGTIGAKNGCPCQDPPVGNGKTGNVDPQIAATSQDVYVSWSDNAKIFLSNSTQIPTSFDTATLDGTGGNKSPPQVAATEDDVYVVWSNSTSVLLSTRTQGGASFSTPLVLGTGDEFSAPEIVAENNDVYVIWKNGTNNVKFAKSVNSGVSFPSVSDIGDADSSAEPQIFVTGSKVYTAWEDNSKIKFRASTDGGATFGSQQDLTDTFGPSITPQISASGTNVYVVWEDNLSALGGDGDIVYVASSDNGDTFGTPVDISLNVDLSSTPVIAAASGNTVYVASKEGTDIIFQIGALGGPEVSFNSPEYTVKDTATITVDDSTSSGSGPISVKVTSTSDSAGIFVDLPEIGSSGIFNGTLAFTNTGSSDDATDVLEADSGDTLEATFGGNGGASKIKSSEINIPAGPLADVSQADYESVWGVEVIDTNADTTSSPDTITVSLTSIAESVDIVLEETGPETGVFGGISSSAVIFMTGDHRVPLGDFELTQNYIQTCNLPSPPNSICDSAVENTVDIRVTSTSDGTGIVITLIETGINTKLFSNTLSLISGSSVNGTSIEAKGGDFVTIDTIGFSVSAQKLLVIPTTQSRSAIEMKFPDLNNEDFVQITYKDSTATLDPVDIAAGGGGGGLVRPGLVVNVLAGAVGGGGGGGPPGPTITLGALALYDSASETISLPQEIRAIAINYDPYTILEPTADIYEDFDFPLSINGNGFVLGGYENTLVPQTVRPGEPVEFVLVFYTTSEVAFTSLNFNLGPTRTIAGSDTQVLLYKDKPAEIIDPNGNIATATGSINNDGELKRVATFSITFSEFIQWTKSDMVIRSWNENLNSGDTIIYDAIQVLPSEEITFVESVTETLTSEELASIPIWVKNNADWWATGQIDDSDFIAGIQYLVEQDIIKVSQTESSSSVTVTEIPDWVRDVAGFWANDLINNVEFVQTIQWLVTNGIVMV